MTDMFVSFNFAGTYKDVEPDVTTEEMEEHLNDLIRAEFGFDEISWCSVEVDVE